MHISSGSKPPAAHGLQTGQGPRMIQPHSAQPSGAEATGAVSSRRKSYHLFVGDFSLCFREGRTKTQEN